MTGRMALLSALLVAIALSLVAGYARVRAPRVAEAGFWFEEISYESRRLGRLSDADLHAIETLARAELSAAFRGLRVHVSDRHEARYRLQVVQDAQDPRFKRPVGVAGQSRAIAGLGGSGVVSFLFLASAAEGYVPEGSDRDRVVEAIGRGIGRTAVHEFTHQLLPKVQIHASRDDRSYEFASAVRPAQFAGPMRWDLAWPLLRKELGE